LSRWQAPITWLKQKYWSLDEVLPATAITGIIGDLPNSLELDHEMALRMRWPSQIATSQTDFYSMITSFERLNDKLTEWLLKLTKCNGTIDCCYRTLRESPSCYLQLIIILNVAMRFGDRKPQGICFSNRAVSRPPPPKINHTTK
jgi:hypothetical protein